MAYLCNSTEWPIFHAVIEASALLWTGCWCCGILMCFLPSFTWHAWAHKWPVLNNCSGLKQQLHNPSIWTGYILESFFNSLTYQYTQAILCDCSRHSNCTSHTDHTTSPVRNVENCWYVGLVYSNIRPDRKWLASAIITIMVLQQCKENYCVKREGLRQYFIILKQSTFVSVTHKVTNCHIYYNWITQCSMEVSTLLSSSGGNCKWLGQIS